MITRIGGVNVYVREREREREDCLTDLLFKCLVSVLSIAIAPSFVAYQINTAAHFSTHKPCNACNNFKASNASNVFVIISLCLFCLYLLLVFGIVRESESRIQSETGWFSLQFYSKVTLENVLYKCKTFFTLCVCMYSSLCIRVWLVWLVDHQICWCADRIDNAHAYRPALLAPPIQFCFVDFHSERDGVHFRKKCEKSAADS